MLLISIITYLLIMKIFYTASVDDNIHNWQYTLFIILLIYIGFYFRNVNNLSVLRKVLIGFTVMTLTILLYFALDNNSVLMYFLNYIFLITAVVLFLAIAYRGLSQFLMKSHYRGTIMIFMYLPCLMDMMVNFVLDEFHITSKSTYVLLFIEAVIITLFFIIPKIKIKTMGVEIRKSIFYFDRKKTERILLDEDEEHVRTEYSISMWIYMNSRDNIQTNFPIFTYANHPNINYGYDAKKEDYFLTINISNSDVIQIAIPNQKWIHFIFNYHSTSVDLFINGELERSIKFSELPFYDTSQIISIGSESLVLDGVITNVYYYTKNVTPLQIFKMYRLGVN